MREVYQPRKRQVARLGSAKTYLAPVSGRSKINVDINEILSFEKQQPMKAVLVAGLPVTGCSLTDLGPLADCPV
ncbi:MAG: hypothetical protein KIT02_02970 [Devosia sp.]|uniref:hypothetical protein n=1 Tax=Devosia sp. TaxID=1871048 RepID=UPI0024C847F0|nr:hypothetical protein [Devosia sp.]UYO00208.1 MAG: hypothetical protein KIT02_02970 [Devosia sp.]